MATKSSFLEEELCCSVCCSIFKEPVLLKCSHSFCKVCLQQWWGEMRSRECPLCRRKASVLDPPPNLALRNIVELYLKQKSESGTVDKSESGTAEKSVSGTVEKSESGTVDKSESGTAEKSESGTEEKSESGTEEKSESRTEEKSESGTVERSEDRCDLHGEKLLIYCENDQETLCLVCQTSKKHRNHRVCSMQEAALGLKGELKTALNPIKEKLERFTKVKQVCEETAEHIRNQAQHTETQVKAEFQKLHQFLRDEEEARLVALREEEEQKSQRMKEEIDTIARHVSTLSDKITAVEKAMHSEDISLLKTYTDIKERAQCTLQDPQLLSGALIDVAKHLGNLKYRVWEKMQETVQYTPVTLDPNTAHGSLCLSDDLTTVRRTDTKQQLPDNPERFDPCVNVLGSEGFTSGKHSWEVEVGNKSAWDVGVVKESINRKGVIPLDPKRGYWVLILRNGDEYRAGAADLTLETKPQRIRVELDYDRGEVSFYDPSDMSLIYTFKHTFTERLLPFFSPCSNKDGSNPAALQTCPVTVSVTH